ncbi:glycoside hydrolase family 88/105 protein [Autumnicola edwardsiae]|uniref:Glycoside hydrolase family 88 protein n=1 Tax=Autumnicola edwardsiae TaxID=3075594 RepID=A0ABU3CT46_9FLAO|nr:glycoside hydrolase family 88 protein [Zunongwangia sp. F297]MDT0649536.1 glycoside hydrolase family 88 protein [Zunongwangia sp. F297]
MRIEEAGHEEVIVPLDLQWSERMVLSVMEENPVPWERSFGDRKYWNYTDGLVLTGINELYKTTRNSQYGNIILDYLNAHKDGIPGYKANHYNIDMINTGKLLFDVYKKTGDTSYLHTLKMLRTQLSDQPRTESGGFWHKKIYPNQMWLDGLYMGLPFYTRYTMTFENGENLNDIIHQFDLIQKNNLDEKTGLLYHGWDESKKMEWADKRTGTSPQFWSRSLGWYMMALVDVLDYFPKDHKGRVKLINYLNTLSTSLVKYQDPSGLWFQVPDKGSLGENYLEASGSLMFAYAFAKGAKKGYLPQFFLDVANNTFDGVLKNLIEVNDDGHLYLNQICSSAGLGGNPYRDGSFRYYTKEAKQVVNDPHGTGSFILAALELGR